MAFAKGVAGGWGRGSVERRSVRGFLRTESREQFSGWFSRAECAVFVHEHSIIQRKEAGPVPREEFLAGGIQVVAGGGEEDEFLAETGG